MQPGKLTENTIRSSGHHITPQRLVILDVLKGSNGHASADEIHSHVRSRCPKLHISTIYRALDMLKRLGLVTETALGDGKLRYHLHVKGYHHHLICEKCGRVEEMDEATFTPLKAALKRKHRFHADLRHLAIFGRCQACA
ncbi:MAG: transcriptional repressor [Dehalococcoidia bacterium]|nr:transcriptional repressor [Dehalococcoidia bacterium]